MAPFRVGLINLQTKTAEYVEIANKIYSTLKSDEVFHNDTEGSIGVRFAKMDLIGLPWQIIVGKKAVSENIIEIKNRATGKVKEVQIEEAINYFNVK